MKNNFLFLSIALLLFGLSACQKDSSTETSKNSNTAATERDPVTPFKGTYTTYPEIVSFENGILTLAIPGKGKATHLGKSTWYADSWVDFNQFPPVQTGVMQFTAANGDQLFGSFSGSGSGIETDDGKVDFAGTYVITSGSGRFEGATGSGTYSGWAFAAGGLGHLEFDGILNNP